MPDTEAQLKSLMLAGLGGDARAYGRLLSRMGGYLRAYFGRRLPAHATEVEDLVQETLLALHLKRETYDPEAPFTPWAYALARYRLLEHLRRARRRIAVPLEDAGELFASDNPEEGAVRRDLRSLLTRLSGRQRRLVVDVKLTGLSIEEAAANSGLSPGAAKVSLHRSLKTLKQAVRDEDS